jgi:serine phosphatase RsbU (regulator of sigma subunit)
MFFISSTGRSMGNGHYRDQDRLTLKNLDAENRRLLSELTALRRDADHARHILDFHDQLEKDFLSAQTMELLILCVVNRLQLRPDIYFVSLCLSRQYLETVLGIQAYDHLLPGFGPSARLRYLTVQDEQELRRHLPEKGGIRFEKTPSGSLEIFFPGHGEEVRSHAIVPLVLRSQVIGSLNLGSIRSRHYYTTEMGPDFLERLAAKLALVLEAMLSRWRLTLQKETLDQDIAKAAILQKDLLPSSPFQMQGLEILSYFKPCQRLGGDFYDFTCLTPDRVAVTIADVSGHGISAALIAAMLKFSLQMDAMEASGPQEIVARINRKFCQVLKQGDYITLCLALIDLRNHTLALTRAGHPHPLLFRPAPRDARWLAPAGPPVGIEERSAYQAMVVDTKPGDLILLYTDGLSEALWGRGEPAGLIPFLSALAGGPGPEPLGSRVYDEVRKRAEAREADDDMSILIVSAL